MFTETTAVVMEEPGEGTIFFELGTMKPQGGKKSLREASEMHARSSFLVTWGPDSQVLEVGVTPLPLSQLAPAEGALQDVLHLPFAVIYDGV